MLHSKRYFILFWTVALLAAAVLGLGVRAAVANEESILITNARVFDGRSAELPIRSVLVEGDRIARISESIEAPEDSRVIDADGRVLMPGLIDMHSHLMLQLSLPTGLTSDSFYFAYVATRAAEIYLMHGFTTVRDASGNTFSLKKAIDEGVIPGPRVYPSGPMISQTAGHSDHRVSAQASSLVADEPSTLMKLDMVQVADGRAEVLTAVRENLRRGATQIKIAVGGGVGSFADPLDVTEYTDDEIRAAVEAAGDWGTYVMAHVYNSKGIERAVNNGVKSIEHANLVDMRTLRLMKRKDVWLSPQVYVFTTAPEGFTEDQLAKLEQARNGVDHMLTMAKQINYQKIVFGTDVLTSPELLEHINDELELRTQWFTPVEVLRQATSNASELLALSGKRNPYGKVGVIEEGAMADLLVVNGNPLEDITILTKPEEGLVLIMKGGKIYKDTLKAAPEAGTQAMAPARGKTATSSE